MSVGEIQQVPQSAPSPVPPLITDAVFQHHVVGADGPQDGVDLFWRPLCVHLIHLLTQTQLDLFHVGAHFSLFFGGLKIATAYNSLDL